MDVKRKLKLRMFLMLALPLLAILLVLVACGGDTDTAGQGGGLETPEVSDGLPTAAPPITGTETVETPVATPVVEETPMVEETPATEESQTAIATESAATEEATAEATGEATPIATTAAGETMEPMVVLPASELIGASIVEGAVTSVTDDTDDDADAIDQGVAFVTDVLINEQGMIQYVLADVTAFIETAQMGTPTPDPAATPAVGTGDILESGVVAIPWASVEVDTRVATDLTDNANDNVANDNDNNTNDNTTNDNDDDANDNAANDNDDNANDNATNDNAVTDNANDNTAQAITVDDVVLRFTGDAGTLSTIPAFDTAILDADGYVLGQNDEDNAVDVPAEYEGLIQVSEYDGFILQTAEGEELGNVQDLLVDLANGQVVYFVVDAGGFLGIGANTVAIPWENATMASVDAADAETDPGTFTVDVTAESLTDAPTLDLSDWNPLVGENWDSEWIEFWNSLTSE
jgi:hypothetical protein